VGLPPGLLAVPLAKSFALLLTEREFTAGFRRGKWWRWAATCTRHDTETSGPKTLRAPGGPTLV